MSTVSLGAVGPYDLSDSPAENILSIFREAFEIWPNNRWTQTLEQGDLAWVDGNCGGASYLVISKSPRVAGTETIVEGLARFKLNSARA
jgi:hypothetical protein